VLVGAAGASTTPRLRLLPLAIDDWNTGHELPDIVEGRLFGGHIFVKVQAGGSALAGLRLHVVGVPDYLRESSSDVPVGLEAGQRGSLHAPLAQVNGSAIPADACPLRVRLRVEAGGEILAEKEHRLLCRAIHDRISFVYIDADGSPQMAAVKFPAVSPKTNRSACPRHGCAVLLSTHGMDVTAQRQADCYRPKQGAWVLAPHGRGTHGFNWQGPGHWSVFYALRALQQRAALWPDGRVDVNASRLIFTGHSNGGYGAWFFGTHYPDLALGVAPLAGMATMGTTEEQAPRLVDPALWALLSSSVEEYRGAALAANLRGKPFMARTGVSHRIGDLSRTRLYII
jgi:hypothetical protein